jgi:hypothetical protein
MKHRLVPTFFALGLSTIFLGAGCRQILDIEEPVACGSDDACTTADSPCIAGECVDGFCAYSFKAAGTVIDEAAEDDCKSNVCDGNGELVVAIVPEDAPPDATPGDCQAPACDAEGNVISGPAEDAPPDDVSGDCSAPACDGQGGVTVAPSDGDVPMMGDAPGDCVRPACSGGAIVDEPNDEDAPADDVPGNCLSPACDAGQVVQLPSEKDAPGEDIDGDCLAPACDMGGMQAIDDTDVPTSGCGSCNNGVVVPWAEVGMACYTGDAGTLNVGACHGGTWACDENNVKVCSGEQVPVSETCTGGGSGVDDDCDMSTDEDGPGCNCQLGQTQACYTGPGGTQNVGICDDGVSTCMMTPNGNQYGSCVGEVLPQACDSCLVAGDQDCSGTAATCTGSHVWSKSIGEDQSDLPTGVLQAPDGTVIVAGTFINTLSLGSSITSDGSTDAFVARFDSDGNSISAKDFGGTGPDSSVQLLALDDGYMLAGRLADSSSETFGSGATLTGVGGDGFIAKFNWNGTIVWKKLLGGTMSDTVRAVARMPDNGVVVVGQFQGTINLGGSNLTSAGFDDIFVVRYDAAGSHLWSKRYGTNMQNGVDDVATTAGGDIVFVGSYATTINFGGSDLVATGGIDGYVVQLDQDGNHEWSRAFQSAGNETATKVVTLSDGSVWAAGTFDTAVNLNGVAGTEISPTSTGNDLLLVKYNSSGSYQTAKAFNGTSITTVYDMAVGFDDGIVISGSYTGSLFFGMIATIAVGTDGFMAKVNAAGTLQWARKPAGSGTEIFERVHVGECGDVFALGRFSSNDVNFGGGDLPWNGGSDIAIAKYRQ